jgi:hypothetical protein
MREIRETKMVEQTTIKFVADDGTEFEDITKCKVYEANKKFKETELAIKPVAKEMELPFLSWLGYHAYKIKTRDEQDIINLYAYFENDGWYTFDEFEKHCEIGKETYIICNDDAMAFLYGGDIDTQIIELAKNIKPKTSKKSS